MKHKIPNKAKFERDFDRTLSSLIEGVFDKQKLLDLDDADDNEGDQDAGDSAPNWLDNPQIDV